MSFTHLEIERQKSVSVIMLFLMLIAVYAAGAWIIVILIRALLLLLTPQSAGSTTVQDLIPGWSGNILIIAIAMTIAMIHWLMSTRNLLPRISSLLEASPLDRDDIYHQRFRNIVEELSVAAGGREIDCAVIPSTAVNAFALADLHGHSLIGVTEGLLAKLSRRQIEAVAAHEAGHIISGDCLTSTVACSLYGIYTATFRCISQSIGESVDGATVFSVTDPDDEEESNGLFAVFYLALIAAAIGLTAAMGMLINTLISRQKEYRADALAVKLTRDPLALAEALHIISGSWSGGGKNIESLAAIFISNPTYEQVNEEDGFIPDLLSTHPPMARRIKLLLEMAHADLHTLYECRHRSAPGEAGQQIAGATPRWFAARNGVWQGPFDIDGLAELSWFGPDTWIKAEKDDGISPACQTPQIADSFKKGNLTPVQCPYCGLAMEKVVYEATHIYNCGHGHGSLVSRQELMKIIARREMIFPPEAIRLADTITSNPAISRITAAGFTKGIRLACPKCTGSMKRRFYSLAYPVITDTCDRCASMWFDRYELEVLQLLVERNEED